ncbi:hypothetical protein HMPREF2656_00715 [Corynebacterium sp. HMSC034B08]|nr:hypothetical protein HMPREF2656_00715 [Corynebacterium sp. HMSC034B08]
MVKSRVVVWQCVLSARYEARPLFKRKADGECAMTEFEGVRTVVSRAFFVLRGLLAFVAAL